MGNVDVLRQAIILEAARHGIDKSHLTFHNLDGGGIFDVSIDRDRWHYAEASIEAFFRAANIILMRLPDTGERREFGTGAVRDASRGKGHFHSIPPLALRKLAKRFEDGAAKYTENNWMKGISLNAYVDSINRHLLAIQEGDESEDHYGALIWNSCTMAWTDNEIQAGRLPKELDDLPYRKR